MKKFLMLFFAVIFVFTFVACGEEPTKEKKENSNIEENESFNIDDLESVPQGVFDDSVIIVDPDDPFTGRWVEIYGDNIMQTVYTFYGDGTGIVEITDIVYYFKYYYDGTTLTLHEFPDTLDEYVERKYEYSMEGNELKLTNEYGPVTWFKEN